MYTYFIIIYFKCCSCCSSDCWISWWLLVDCLQLVLSYRITFTWQLINRISSVLQKLFRYFNGIAVSTSFVLFLLLLFCVVFPIILLLLWNYMEFVIGSALFSWRIILFTFVRTWMDDQWFSVARSSYTLGLHYLNLLYCQLTHYWFSLCN